MKVVVPSETLSYHSIASSLYDKLSSCFPINITNRSRFGSTISQGYDRLKNDLGKGIDSEYVLLEYGGNDCDFNWQEVSDAPDIDHDPKTPLAAFTDTLGQMVEMLKEVDKKPVLMTLPPIDAERYLQFISRGSVAKDNVLHWLGDVQMIYRFQELYSNTIRTFAFEHALPLIDVRSRFLDKHNYSSLISRDGIHPSNDGYQLIFSTIADYLNGWSDKVFKAH